MLCLALLACIVSAISAGTAHAETVTYTTVIPLTKTNWAQSIPLPKFPTASGTLTSVSVTLASTIEGTLAVESVDPAPSTVTSHLAAELTLTRPDGSALLSHAPEDSKVGEFSAFDGTVDFAGNSGGTYSIAATSTSTADLGALSASDMALFSGEGTIDLPLSAEGVSRFDGAGNLQSESTLSASATATVTYGYVTPDLSISMQAQGPFTVGGRAAITLTVTNVGTGPTVGLTTVSDTLPSGLSPVAVAGTDWACTIAGQAIECLHQGHIAAGAIPPPITITVAIGSRALPSVQNTAAVATAADLDAQNGTNSTTIVLSAISAAGTAGTSPSASTAGTSGNAAGTTTRTTDSETTAGTALAPGAYGGGLIDEVSNSIDAQGCAIPDALINRTLLSGTESCFQFVPDRPITFTDIGGHPASPSIEALKKTQIRLTGDYIVSGHGNHSSGKQQQEFRSGAFPFQPDRSASRLEVVKIALIANCIPIDDDIPATWQGFTDIPGRHSDDAAQDFLARIFSTAARHGVATGYPDGTARPFAQANNAEILALLLRASGAQPKGFTAGAGASWYEPYVLFARANHLVDSSFDPAASMDRGALSTLVFNIMALNPDPAIASYVFQLDLHSQQFAAREFFYPPVPQVGSLTPSPGLSCEERAPAVNACLAFDPAGRRQFRDILPQSPLSAAVGLLTETFVLATGDAVLADSGNGLFRPENPATRAEVLRSALAANCIPVSGAFPQEPAHFTDLPQAASGDASLDEAVRVFTTAAEWGIVQGDAEGNARPFAGATLLDALAIMLRASGAVPDGYTAENSLLPTGYEWGEPYAAFAIRNGLIGPTDATALLSPITRGKLASLLAKAMEFSPDIGVRSFRTSVGALLR